MGLNSGDAPANPPPGVQTIEVSDEMIRDLADWSKPVLLKIERGEDGKPVLLIREVD